MGPEAPIVRCAALEHADDFVRAIAPFKPKELFLGVDIATKAGHPALTALAWTQAGHPEVVAVWKVVSHEALAQLLGRGSDAYRAAAVDVPSAWPRSFTAMLTEHETGPLQHIPTDGGEAQSNLDGEAAADWRTVTLALRATDRQIHRRYHMRPIAVSFDKLGATAAAWALIEAALGPRLDRTGRRASDADQRILETYPAAQLRAWHAPVAKRRKQPPKPRTLAEIEDRLGSDRGNAPICAMLKTLPSDVRSATDENPDVRDSLVCAITAALAERDPQNTHPILEERPSLEGEDARAEGVIWLHDKAFCERPADR